MMPVAEASQPPQTDHADYKKKYKTLKRKLSFLLYEHECFLEELRKAQRKLLKVSRDKSFLLDRLLQYEKVDDSSSDSDATASSDSDAEANKDGASTKKKKAAAAASAAATPQVPIPTTTVGADAGMAALLSTLTTGQVPPQTSVTTAQLLQQVRKTSEVPKKKPKVSKKAVKQASLPGMSSGAAGVAFSRSNSDPRPPGHMTREELERHLELKQSRKPQFMSIEKAPHMLPDDIFSNENSNPDSDLIDINMIKEELMDDTDLIIDVPMD